MRRAVRRTTLTSPCYACLADAGCTCDAAGGADRLARSCSIRTAGAGVADLDGAGMAPREGLETPEAELVAEPSQARRISVAVQTTSGPAAHDRAVSHSLRLSGGVFRT